MTSQQNIGYIYSITNVITGKIYIGQTINAFQRKADHFNNFLRGKHCNKRIQTDVDIYGTENFKFEVIQECNQNELNTLEEHYIRAFDSRNPATGYNIASVPVNWMYKNPRQIVDAPNYSWTFFAWAVRTTVLLFISQVSTITWVSILFLLLSIPCVVITAYYLHCSFRSCYGV